MVDKADMAALRAVTGIVVAGGMVAIVGAAALGLAWRVFAAVGGL